MKQFALVLVLIALLGGGYWLWQNNTSTELPNSEDGIENTADGMMEDGTIPESTDTSSNASMTAKITYDGEKYSPSSVTIKKGGTVNWVNTNSDVKMWVASAQHPTHMVYSGTARQEHCPDTSNTAFDQCEGGDAYSFTFEKVGEWGFHDHINTSAWGKITVIE